MLDFTTPDLISNAPVIIIAGFIGLIITFFLVTEKLKLRYAVLAYTITLLLGGLSIFIVFNMNNQRTTNAQDVIFSKYQVSGVFVSGGGDDNNTFSDVKVTPTIAAEDGHKYNITIYDDFDDYQNRSGDNTDFQLPDKLRTEVILGDRLTYHTNKHGKIVVTDWLRVNHDNNTTTHLSIPK